MITISDLSKPLEFPTKGLISPHLIFEDIREKFVFFGTILYDMEKVLPRNDLLDFISPPLSKLELQDLRISEQELENGKGTRFSTIQDLFDDLDSD